MNLKKFFKLYITVTISVFATACTTSAPDDNCKEQVSDATVMCYKYSHDECGNIICAQDAFNQADYFTSILKAVQESGKYTTRDSVAAYLCKFDKLPSNYVNKDKGQNLYESKTGKTFEKWNFNPWTTIGVMIGGDKFDNYASNNNYHATLPQGSYHEADVEYSAKNRGTKRLVYQSDCVIYYTADHYETFSRLEIR
jgi:hypothetical protein